VSHSTRQAPDPGEPRIIPQEVSDWLFGPCSHCGTPPACSHSTRRACVLCFEDAAQELIALRERRAAIDTETPGLERTIKELRAELTTRDERIYRMRRVIELAMDCPAAQSALAEITEAVLDYGDIGARRLTR